MNFPTNMQGIGVGKEIIQRSIKEKTIKEQLPNGIPLGESNKNITNSMMEIAVAAQCLGKGVTVVVSDRNNSIIRIRIRLFFNFRFRVIVKDYVAAVAKSAPSQSGKRT